MAYHLDVNVPKLVMVGASSVLILAVVLLGAHGYFLKLEREEFAAKNFNTVSRQLDEVQRRTSENLHTFRWIDQKSGTVQLPIDEAIRVMAQTKGNPPTTQPLGAP